jgi:hypothetical protein
MGGGPAAAGMDESRKGGRVAALGSLELGAATSQGIPAASLTEPRDILAGILRDLDSWNPHRHEFNPALWQGCAERGRRALRLLDQVIAAVTPAEPVSG